MDGSPDLDMLRIRARQEMEPGEQLRWVGRPHPWALARQRLAAVAVTPVLLGLGAFVIHVGASQPLPVDQAMLTMVIYGFGGLAMLLALVVISGPVLAFRRARRTVYAVSDRRLLTISGERVDSYGPDDIRAIMVTNERADGSADIVFGQDIRRYWVRGARFAEVNRLGFFGIPDPDAVRELIRDLRGEPTD
ncbi:MAG TPA: hypothetical protein VMQ73_24090 [Methylomirabilota bacterium]|nr:hypothetical protein [Methylomirabilota bacterium]